ncbi:MAG: hypothetical protein QOF21_2184, partial [Actinomycetota bacterium]
MGEPTESDGRGAEDVGDANQREHAADEREVALQRREALVEMR